MPRKRPKLRLRRGRPAYDWLAIYLFVEAGRRNKKLSAYAFCMEHGLAIVTHRNEPIHDDFEVRPTLSSIHGTTLYRRFMEAKRNIFIPGKMPKGLSKSSELRNVIEGVLEPLINDFRAAA